MMPPAARRSAGNGHGAGGAKSRPADAHAQRRVEQMRIERERRKAAEDGTSKSTPIHPIVRSVCLLLCRRYV